MKQERPGRGPEAGDGRDEEAPQPRFALGRLLATPGAMEALVSAEVTPFDLILRHVTGDWGVVPDEDKEANERAVLEGTRILSAYVLETGVKVWLITEWDRSATTLLLPMEY